MQRALTCALGATVLATMAVPALGADIGAPPLLVPPPGYDWTGLYIGGNAGGIWGDFKGSASLNDGSILIFGSNFGGSNNTNSSWKAGGQIGYNWQVQQWVFGLEGDFDGMNIRETFIAPANTLPSFNQGYTISLKSNWLASIRGRYGYTWNNWLFYVTGGVAFANIQGAFNFSNVVAATTNGTTAVGGTGGVGFEVGFWNNWSFGAEYRLTGFENLNFGPPGLVPTAGGTSTSPVTISSKLTTNEVTARLNYRFNWGTPLKAGY